MGGLDADFFRKVCATNRHKLTRIFLFQRRDRKVIICLKLGLQRAVILIDQETGTSYTDKIVYMTKMEYALFSSTKVERKTTC